MMVNDRVVTLGRTGDTSAEPEWVRLLLLHDDGGSGLRTGAEDYFVALRFAGHVSGTMRATIRFKLGI